MTHAALIIVGNLDGDFIADVRTVLLQLPKGLLWQHPTEVRSHKSAEDNLIRCQTYLKRKRLEPFDYGSDF